MEAVVISEKGLRPRMEDFHHLDLNFGGQGWIYGGIYDGHSGDYAAAYAARNLHRLFLEKILGGLPPGLAFTQSYEETSRALSGQESGTTAVDFFIRERKIFTANAGDSRAIVVSRKGLSILTTDHRIDNAEEKERVLTAGASISPPYVIRDGFGLMPTRSIGDRYFKEVGVIASPSLNEREISRDDLLLISACDGLWDFMSNEEAAALARENPEPERLLEILKREVLVNRMGTDNLTIIAVSFREKESGQSARHS